MRDFGSADGSIRRTLEHILQSERAWLRRIQDGTPSSPSLLSTAEDWGKLVQEWRGIHRDWRSWVSFLSDDDADATLEYTDSKGATWKQPLWQIVLHVVNHSTHHRGQVSGFLRALGRTPPSLDFIAFMREQDASFS